MKKTIILSVLLIISLTVFCQTPQAFNYQATVRNADGDVQINIGVAFTIELIREGNTIYTEQHLDLNTGKIGVVNLKVGEGISSNDFESIDWSQGNIKMKVSFSIEGGDDQIMPETELVAVPFALYAQNSGDSHWIKTDTSLHYSETKIGVGTNTPTVPLHIHSMSHNQGLRLSTEGIDESIYLHLTESNSGVEYGFLHLGGQTNLRGNGRNSVFEGRVGIGTNAPQGKLHVNSNGELIRLQGVNHAYLSFYQHPNNAERSGYLGYGSSSNNNFYLVNDQDGSMVFRTSNVTRMIISEGGNIGVGTTQPSEKLHVAGTTQTCILKITGGCDIKEDLNSKQALEPGDIVVIDENNPGEVCHTTKEYDRKVAGVISGANGINSGLSLSQEDVLEGEFPLTMLGRVYVKVIGSVRVGDLITTSSKEGYGMAVRDYSRTPNTVIGKAMTENKGGDGMVLVLVNLQ